VSRRMLAGVITALPALLWTGSEVYGALKEADKIPVIEERLDAQAKDIREMRKYMMELLMLQNRAMGNTHRERELIELLKEVR
jgi:hypothetical protein